MSSPARIRIWALCAAALVAAGVVALANCARIESGIYRAGVGLERGRAGLEAGWIDTGEEHLAFVRRTGTGPQVVLIHGFASNKDIWLQMIQALPDDFGVIALDLPGHGDSSREPEREYAVEDLARAVMRALESLDAGPVHLAGSSLGGAVAAVVTAERPDLVHSLGLFNPAGAPGAEASVLRDTDSAEDHPLIIRDREDFDEMVALVFHQPPPMPWPVARVLTRYHAERAELHLRIWTDLWEDRRPAAPLLERITVPVLLVWGERDRVLDQASVDFFRDHVRDLQVVILPESGHTPILEEPGTSAGHYAGFVRAVAMARTLGGSGGAEPQDR